MALTLDGDNGISGINGSATTPAVQGTDTNTGLTFGTDEVNIVTGGSERFKIGSAGQLGIGGATYGSSGQFLQSQGASAAPQWATVTADTGNDYNFASGSANAQIITISSIPSDATKIDVNLNGIGWNTASSNLAIKLGDSSSINTTAGGYTWTNMYTGASTNYTNTNNQILLNNGFGGTSERIYGTVMMNRVTNNAWIITWQGISKHSLNYVIFGSGWGYSGTSNPLAQFQLSVNVGAMSTGSYNVNVYTE